MEATKKKTILVGLDAAAWEYLDPLVKAGKLPTIQRLMDQGAWGTLHSTLPAITPVAWASIVTGKNPGKHGIYDFTARQPGSYQFALTSGRTRLGTPIWKRLNEQGLRVGMVNVPFTHPPEPLDGFVVGGFGAPNKARDITYPEEALGLIEAQFGEYLPNVKVAPLKKEGPERIMEVERSHQEQQVKIAVELAERYQVDVLILNLMLLDHANHYMPTMEQIEDAIIQSDVHLNFLIENFHPDHVMLISDHGSRRVRGDFLLNVWMQDHGYSAQVKRSSQDHAEALNWMLTHWLSSRVNGMPESVLRRVLREILLHSPEGFSGRFWEKIERDIPYARRYVMEGRETDYTRTHLFSGSQYNGVLYFNVAGREPTGVVRPEERESLGREIIDQLKQLVDPSNGKLIFNGAYLGEDLYAGDTLYRAPDLILDSYSAHCGVWEANYQYAPGEKLRDRYFVDNRGDFGAHSRDGIFVYTGPGFGCGPVPGDFSIMDIPATLLYLHGLPIPEDFDGKPMMETMLPAFVAERPVTSQPGDVSTEPTLDSQYSAEEAAEMIEHLRALGYVE